MSGAPFERFLGTSEMLAAFDASALFQGMLDFEAALARAEAAEGSIPPAAAGFIAAACHVRRYDVDALEAAGARAGSLAIPLVKALTEAVAAVDAEAAGYVHWGSTSQDVIDTAMVLATRRALQLIDADLGRLIDALRELDARHGAAAMLGRTLLQPAQVISFGFKLVSWIAPLVRARTRLRAAARDALRLQLGGAVGTLAMLGERGPAVAARMAADLGLAATAGAWQTQRDDWVLLGCEVGVLAGSLGKIAADIALLAQGEIAEVAEPSGAGRGGSSAMPHKRNPVASMIALAAATRTPQRVAALLAAMPQQHERGLGNWQAELAEWPGLFVSTHGALHALADAAGGLTVDAARMRANIEALQGLVFSEAAAMVFAPHLGMARAQALVEQCSKDAIANGRHLRDATQTARAADAGLAALVSAADVDAAFDVDRAAAQATAVARRQLDALH
ncbi:MAG: 3-carboxy-cis,cis-muconate cycloisomerase [Proteobacteria bacterium]|nr:3-carboxy-cis,cis-muconate cycloisomerase [Pseudomonadota bacterium]